CFRVARLCRATAPIRVWRIPGKLLWGSPQGGTPLVTCFPIALRDRLQPVDHVVASALPGFAGQPHPSESGEYAASPWGGSPQGGPAPLVTCFAIALRDRLQPVDHWLRRPLP